MAEKTGAGGEPQEYNPNNGQYGSGTSYRQNTSYDEILKDDKKYSKAVDSAVMNKYSTVRKKVDKFGFTIIKVNDGKNFYIVRINKSDNDFDYDILKVWKIND